MKTINSLIEVGYATRKTVGYFVSLDTINTYFIKVYETYPLEHPMN